MGQALVVSAEELGCSERTLRRYINGGLLHGRRVARRQLELSHAEADYLYGHWKLLSNLVGALRSERDVRLAVLFGSVAVGEDDVLSDVDLLIAHRRPDPRTQAALKLRLRRALDRPVDIVALEQAQAQPSLLADVLHEGRVLIDRENLWGELQRRRNEILREGGCEDELIASRARAAVADARARLKTA
jgi:predicted nucleotidyltransferase